MKPKRRIGFFLLMASAGGIGASLYFLVQLWLPYGEQSGSQSVFLIYVSAGLVLLFISLLLAYVAYLFIFRYVDRVISVLPQALEVAGRVVPVNLNQLKIVWTFPVLDGSEGAEGATFVVAKVSGRMYIVSSRDVESLPKSRTEHEFR